LPRTRRHRVAVHRAGRERRKGAARDDGAGEHAAERVLEPDALFADAVDVREHEPARFFERDHASVRSTIPADLDNDRVTAIGASSFDLHGRYFRDS
jgi:hypothetical protein